MASDIVNRPSTKTLVANKTLALRQSPNYAPVGTDDTCPTCSEYPKLLQSAWAYPYVSSAFRLSSYSFTIACGRL